MYNTKRTKKNIRSKQHVISEDDLYLLLNATKDKDRVLVILTGFFGLREGEACHFRKDWIHVSDSDAEYFKVNHISIPDSGTMECWCNDCMLRAYKDFKKTKGLHHDTTWHEKMQKRFYKHKSAKRLNDLFEKYNIIPTWRPKTPSGERRVPFLESDTVQYLLQFFADNKTIGIDRFGAWHRINQAGKKYLDKNIFPHALRATFGTLLARKGLNIFTVKNVMGHKEIATTDQYIESDPMRALGEIKKAYKL